MRLYERLGVSLDGDIALDARLMLLENRLADDPKTDPIIARSLDINDREPAVLACYLLERNAAAKEHAGLLIEQVVDYLFGDWRNTYASTEGVPDASSPTGTRSVRVTRNAAECRRQLTWMRAFRAGLLWALCLGREESVRRIASYPADDVYGEDFGGDFGPRHKSYYILLSALVLNPGRPPAGRHVEQVERAGRKKPKLLLAALREAQRRDAGAFGK